MNHKKDCVYIKKIKIMNVGIIGCGWLGERLLSHLSDKHRMYVTIRTKRNLSTDNYYHCLEVDFDNFIPGKWQVLSDLDSIIIAIPFGRRLSVEILQNRLKNICNFIEGFNKQLFFTSSVGIYPSVNGTIDENFPIPDLQPELYFVEKYLKDKFPKINILRLGGLMGDDRYLSKYVVSESHQMVNHIHYQDVCRVIERIMTFGLHSKTYNIVAPKHPTKQEIMNHQTGIHLPLEFAYGKIVTSEKVIRELDYDFLYPNPLYF